MLFDCGVGEDSWESFGLQRDQIVNPEGNQSWIFTGRTDAEAEAVILWPPDTKSWLIGKGPGAGKDWGQKRATEDEMVGWNHRLNGHEFEQILGDSEGQGSLECCSPWGLKELDMTEWLNNNIYSSKDIAGKLYLPLFNPLAHTTHNTQRSECEVTQLCPTVCHPMDYSPSCISACHVPLSVEFSGQEYWNG